MNNNAAVNPALKKVRAHQREVIPLKHSPKWHGLPPRSGSDPRCDQARHESSRSVVVPNYPLSQTRRTPASQVECARISQQSNASARCLSCRANWFASPVPQLIHTRCHGVLSARSQRVDQAVASSLDGRQRSGQPSEAALLARTVSDTLSDGGLSFRQELNMYNDAFHEVTRQVSVHYQERVSCLPIWAPSTCDRPTPQVSE
jgi:hypothetical protein